MRSLIAALLLLLSAAPAAAAKTYTAERYDARIRVLPGGEIEVTETAVFRFVDGTFDHVFREIPTRRTDGIEVVSASMDGRDLPFGDAPGQVEVERGSRVNVRWRFAPRSGTTHSFVLKYLVRGAIRREAAGDVLDWVALPTKHEYRIDASEVVVESPSPWTTPPTVDVERVGEHTLEPSNTSVRVSARSIGKNGWIRTRLAFPAGTLIAAAPAWQQRQTRANALAPRWWTAAGVILALGAVLLFALRQRYDRPPHSAAGRPRTFDAPPDTLRPALGGALASNGSITLQHAMGTLFTLADRGVLTVEETPASWGQRHFVVHRRTPAVPLMPEESVLIDLAFPSSDPAEAGVPLSKVRSRIAGKIDQYRARVKQELRVAGLYDDDRARVRRAFFVCSITALVAALALIIPAALLRPQYGDWPFLLPATGALVAVAAVIIAGTLTPLSNEGVRRGEDWRAYARHLNEVARDRAPFIGHSAAALLPFAIALGLAGPWSRFLKHRPSAVPPWFRTMTGGDEGAFPAFIAAGGAGHVGGAGGGAAGGAAGGGASGAG